MNKLNKDLNDFFYSSINGFELLLSENRLKNKELIMVVYECLLKEKYFTHCDIEHLRNFSSLVELIEIPMFSSCQSFIETESYLKKQVGKSIDFELRFTLEYLFFLFLKNSLIDCSTEEVRIELSTWRIIQKFSFLEHNVLAHYVHWLTDKGFSKRAILGCLCELYKLCTWLESHKLEFEQVNNFVLDEYLFEKIKQLKQTTRSKRIGDLKPFLIFYKEELSLDFKLPTITATCKKNKYIEQKLSSLEITKLKEASLASLNKSEGALMINLMIEYGVPFKALPFVKMNDNKLLYCLRLPSRLGHLDKEIVILSNSRLEELVKHRQKHIESDYLFQSLLSNRKAKPISRDYCQRKIQDFAQTVLGFPISAQQICRDALKSKAKGRKLTQFIDETEPFEISRRTKLQYWLSTS